MNPKRITGVLSPVVTPKRSRADASSLQTTTTARDPMCFSWQTARVAPWAR